LIGVFFKPLSERDSQNGMLVCGFKRYSKRVGVDSHITFCHFRYNLIFHEGNNITSPFNIHYKGKGKNNSENNRTNTFKSVLASRCGYKLSLPSSNSFYILSVSRNISTWYFLNFTAVLWFSRSSSRINLLATGL